jgi:hypothetical protein
MNRKRLAFICLAIVALVIVAGLAGYAVSLLGQRTSPSITNAANGVSTSTNHFCTRQVTISGYTQFCAAPLSYTAFQRFVNQASSIEHQNGAIILTVGYHPCTDWFYVLPNGTDVEVLLGTVNATQICR